MSYISGHNCNIVCPRSQFYRANHYIKCTRILGQTVMSISYSCKCINSKGNQQFLTCYRSQSNISFNGQFLNCNNCTHVHVELTAGVGGHVHVN